MFDSIACKMISYTNLAHKFHQCILSSFFFLWLYSVGNDNNKIRNQKKISYLCNFPTLFLLLEHHQALINQKNIHQCICYVLLGSKFALLNVSGAVAYSKTGKLYYLHGICVCGTLTPVDV